MCGIAGFWVSDLAPRFNLETAGLRMASAIAHRGPDRQDIWLSEAAGVVLAHRRLSIIDLSAAGSQPMLSASGRYVIIYNGELYNHLGLRRSLAVDGSAPVWRGHSDTETLLALIERDGLKRAVQQIIGMYAFALWDCAENTLSFVRDRTGEKPLYYGWVGGTLLFGSELKALSAFPGFVASIDTTAAAEFLRFGYVPTPRSIYTGISKLPPATILTVRTPNPTKPVNPESYWSLSDLLGSGASMRAATAYDADSLETLLTEVVGSQMISDVPLGVFLSGGVDSSLITALMQRISPRPVRSFSIGFEESRLNEAPYAKAVAAHLGTDHTEMIVTARDAMGIVPDLPSIFDEPFADSSQIPTTLLARMSRQHVTVALSGDGGDELFGGYNRYTFGHRLWRLISSVPRPLRGIAARVLELAAALGGRRPLQAAADALQLPRTTVSKLDSLAAIVADARDLADVHLQFAGIDPRALLSQRVDTAQSHAMAWNLFESAVSSGAEHMMAVDTVTYLPDDILVKVDRATMSVSLESRAPFLDARIVEYAWQLPLSAKIGGGTTKRILHEVLYRHVPRHLINRPKQGFEIPLDAWLRTGLKDWASALLSPQALSRSGLLVPASVAALWEAHLSGSRNAGSSLWRILMLQAWLERPAHMQ